METHLGGQRLSSEFGKTSCSRSVVNSVFGITPKYFSKVMEWSNGSNYDIITRFATVTVTLLRY